MRVRGRFSGFFDWRFLVLQQTKRLRMLAVIHINLSFYPGRPSPVRAFFARIGRRASAAPFVCLALIAPAFLFACSAGQEMPDDTFLYITRAETATAGADLFFFEAAPPNRLDSYTRLSATEGVHSCTSAGNGAAVIVLLSNVTDDPYTWADIDTYASLSHKSFLLDDESLAAQSLSCKAFLEAGWSRASVLSPSTSMVKVRLLDISCDFSGRPYEGAVMENVKIYLTRACIECQPLKEDRGITWANPGMADSVALARMKHPEYLYRCIEGSVGPEPMQCGIDLYTYPNPDDGDNGTRLVIECTIQGSKCYYPLRLPPLQRNTVYEASVQITRMGTPDPDILAENTAASVNLRVLPWENRPGETVTF